jgi:hypothetical protein
MQAIGHYCQAIPGFSGTVARVGENGVGLRSLFDDGGSGAVCDRSFIDLFDPEWGRFLCSNPYLLGSVNYKQAVSVGAKV